MSRFLNLLLLLFCFINYIESTKSSPRSVTGKKGGRVTLSCDFEDGDILDITLSTFSNIIHVCQNEEDCRIFKEGSCDVIIKDLRFSDAGKYILRVYYRNDQTELQRLTLEYQLDIHESSTRSVTGEQGGRVTLPCDFENREISDIALSRFSNVIHICQNEEDGRIFKNGSCDVIIKDLRFSDAGRYILRVYYYDDQTELKRLTLEYQLDIHEKPHRDEEQYKSVIIVVCVTGALLLVLVISPVIWKHRRQPRNAEHEAVAMKDIQ